MELIAFINFIKRRRLLIFAITVTGGALGVLIFALSPKNYAASLHIYVKRETAPPSQDYYSYDGYYALQASEEYADTALGLIKSLDVLKRGAEISSYVPRDTKELRALSGKIKVIKKAPQLIQISLTDRDVNKGKEVVSALAQASQERIRLLNQTGDPSLSIDLIDPEPLVVEKKLSLLYFSGAGIGLGLTFGLLVAAIKDYLSLTQKH